MDLSTNKDLDKFLGNIDQISDIIKGLNATDEEARGEAIGKADELLNKRKGKTEKTGFNKTVINRSTSNQTDETPSATHQESFMKAVERDAEERAQRKMVAKAEATVFKDKGNEAFKAQDYERAVEFYTQGLGKLKDFKELWTNRAQAYMRLGKFDEALNDCDWAQRCDENYVKAYVLEAKAHTGLNNYSKAIEVYGKAKEIDPTKEALIDGFIREVELSRDSVSQEKEARKLFESGARHPRTLVEIMKKVSSEGEVPLYYDGGIRVLADLLAESKSKYKVLFRTEGGLKIYAEHPFFTRTMLDCDIGELSKEELDACSSMFTLLRNAVSSEGESQRQLICQDRFVTMIMRFLDSKLVRKANQAKESCLHLLLSLTEGDIGRKYICSHFDLDKLICTISELVPNGGHMAVKSFDIVKNMANESKFKKHVYNNLEIVLPAYEQLLSNDRHTDIIPYCISVMNILCTDDKIRVAMSGRSSMVDACCFYLDKFPSSCLNQYKAHYEAVHTVLGLIMNITVAKTDVVVASALKITKVVLAYLDKCSDIQERVIGCLSHLLPVSGEATEYFISDMNRLEALYNGLISKEFMMRKFAVKTLTACTQHSQNVCKAVSSRKKEIRLKNSVRENLKISTIQHGKMVSSLRLLLNDSNVVLLGNVCLCLSHIIHEPSVHKSLSKEDLKRLLVIIREVDNSTAKQNCAVLIGKLAKADSSHLEMLRELDGIGILHSSTRHYNV